jgi:thiamine pyrophosphokinase
MMLGSLLDVSAYRSILCLDGALPEAAFFKMNLPVIAADGAANQLMRMGIEPSMVIGDLDSISPENRAILKTHYHFDQDFCDFQKSLQYLQSNQLLPAIIVGVNGGTLDHILNNVNIFMTSTNFLYAPPLMGMVMRPHQERELKLPLDTKISMLGIPSAVVTTRGLKWELANSHLSFPGHNSCFNRNTNENVSIKVDAGSLLILIYSE